MDDKYQIVGGDDLRNPAAPTLVNGLDDNSNKNSHVGVLDSSHILGGTQGIDNNIPGYIDTQNNDITTYEYNKNSDYTVEKSKEPPEKILGSTEKEVDYGHVESLDNNLFEGIDANDPSLNLPVNSIYSDPVDETSLKHHDVVENAPDSTKYNRHGGLGCASHILSYFTAISIVVGIFSLLGYALYFLNSSTDIFSHSVEGISTGIIDKGSGTIVHDIDNYYKVVNNNNSSKNTDISSARNNYWALIFARGHLILDEIESLRSKTDKNKIIIDKNGDKILFTDLLDISEEYVNVHVAISRIFMDIEVKLGDIAKNIKDNQPKRDTFIKIDGLRASNGNMKGGLTQVLQKVEDLRTERIVGYYFGVLDDINSKLIQLKVDVGTSDITRINKDLQFIESLYDSDEQSIAEAIYYVDYTTQKPVKAVSN